jgi:transcriptional regulator with XRE-family HTH domain
MNENDRMQLLIKMAGIYGQAAVARRIGYSPSAVCQILKGEYKGDKRAILQRVEEEFGDTTADCPVYGDISLKFCAEERKKGFSTSRADIWLACRACPRGGAA